MARFLSAEWITELADLAATSERLRAAAAGPPLVVQQIVTDTDGREVCWWLELGGGQAEVQAGRASRADVTFTTDATTGAEIAAGTLSAQTAFMTGRLRVGGNVGVLLERRATLSGLGDVFAAARSPARHSPS